MKVLVAVKRVPDGNVPIRLKADGSGVDLAGMPMCINPFDEVALEAAVQWKEAGTITEIVVVSIGGAACQETLRHALALGADRVIHVVTDQELEPLAIANLLRVLAKREQPDLILLGKQSSDHDNAQVAPMLAALLDFPQGIAASVLALEDRELIVTCEVEGGQETLALTLPAVISTDLRLAKPRYLRLPQLLQAKKKPIEVLDVSALIGDISPNWMLPKGIVQSVCFPRHRRSARRVSSVEELLTCLEQEGLRQGASSLNSVNAVGLGRADLKHGSSHAVILAEHDGQTLHSAMRHTVSAASQLADDITVVVVGDLAIANQVSMIAGVSRVLFASASAHPLAEELAPMLAQVVLERHANALLAGATPFGKAILPRAAALLDSTVLTDVVEILAPDIFVRPIHAGEVLATICSQAEIKILSVRPAAFAPALGQPAAPVEILRALPIIHQSTWRSTSLSDTTRPTLGNARIVIGGGRGLGTAEQFHDLLNPLADQLNAAIGATRAAVDAAFVSNDHQVGQTGAIVAPEFYFAIGLSGAAQHLAGMRDSRVIIAINRDSCAPICQQADYVLEGDLFEIVPELTRRLAIP